ncbi:hypothetical protein U9M48_011935 [Paspalum notatum var. saurae]|uniref:Uncharacterized protein n=1 Tax=Paspalum notatum var. saurae TaxID=547442 RepID=A0AAQ3WHV4_PASNO
MRSGLELGHAIKPYATDSGLVALRRKQPPQRDASACCISPWTVVEEIMEMDIDSSEDAIGGSVTYRTRRSQLARHFTFF